MIESLQAGGEALGPFKAVGTAGKILKPAAQGAISGFAFFDPHEERLANMIQAWPAVANPVTEFLAAKEDDGRLEGRLKRSLEEAGFGVAAEGAAKLLGSSLRAYKKFRAAKAAAEASPEAAEAVFKGMNEAASETNAAEALETTPAQRMIKSDHPYGWSGPDRDIVPVEAEPIKRKGAADTSLTETGGVPVPQRPVVSSLVYNQNGTLHIEESRRAVNKAFTGLLESWGLKSATTGKGTVGARKVLPIHEQTGWSAEIGKGDLREILNTAQTEADFAAMEYIPELWRTSAYKKVKDWAEAKKKGNVKGFYKAVHEFENEIKIGAEHYSVKITVKETANGRHYYHHKLYPIKKNPSGTQGSAPSQGKVSLTPTNSDPYRNISQSGG